MAKIADLKVKVGTFMKDGKEKGRWITVGSEIEAENGGSYFLINRTFNPAGVPVDDPTRDAIRVSRFPVGENEQTGGGYTNTPAPAGKPLGSDDIPF